MVVGEYWLVEGGSTLDTYITYSVHNLSTEYMTCTHT